MINGNKLDFIHRQFAQDATLCADTLQGTLTG